MIVKDMTQRHVKLAHIAAYGQPHGQAEVEIALQSDYLRYDQYRIPYVASKSLRHQAQTKLPFALCTTYFNYRCALYRIVNKIDLSTVKSCLWY